MSDIYSLKQGDGPLILSIPHAGTDVPEDIASRFSDVAKPLPDTDWHIPLLYDFVQDMDATIITAKLSRYVVDLNRPPDDESLYPGQNTTGLCPDITFDGDALYLPGQEPSAGEIATRRDLYWKPYHHALRNEIARVKAANDKVYLYDAHSIRAEVPRLFTGILPDLNLGTNDGTSCAPDIQDRVEAVLRETDYSAVINGRFRGGYITRRYGDPEHNVHALQMELAQKNYMDEAAPYDYQPEKADKLKPVLRAVIEAMLG